MSNTRNRPEVPVDRVLAVAALAIALGALAITFVDTTDVTPQPHEVVSTAGPDHRHEITALQARVRELQQRISPLQLENGRSEVLTQSNINDMVEKALADREAASKRTPSIEAAAQDRTNAEAVSLAQQLENAPFGADRDDLWQKLRELHGVDAAADYFEQVAAANPGSADAQTDLGNALIQKMLQSTDEQQRIELGKRIEQQFDQALELRPDHWEARFRKAVGMTYGPPLSGQQTQAIVHFEKLVAQQANSAPSSGYSQTYLYLGRLYAQRGDAERARQVWQNGLARHPQSSELQELVQ